MKNRVKISILWIMMLAIASLIATGSVLAEQVEDVNPHKFNTGHNKIEVFLKANWGSSDEQCFKYSVPKMNKKCDQNPISTVVIKYFDNCKFELKVMKGEQACDTVKKDGDLYVPRSEINNAGEAIIDEERGSDELTGIAYPGSECGKIFYRYTAKKEEWCNARCYGSGADMVCWR